MISAFTQPNVETMIATAIARVPAPGKMACSMAVATRSPAACWMAGKGSVTRYARTDHHSDDNGDGIEQTKTLRELARGGSRSPDCDAAVTSIATHQALRGQGH